MSTTLVSADFAGQTAGVDLSTVNWPVGGAFSASAVTGALGQLIFSGSSPSTVKSNTAGISEYNSATTSTTGDYDLYGCFPIVSTVTSLLTGLSGHIQSISGTNQNCVCVDINPAGGTSATIRFYARDGGSIVGPNAGGVDNTTVTVSAGQFICLHLWFTGGGTVAHAAYSISNSKVLPANLPSQTYTNVTHSSYTIPTTSVDLTPKGRFGVNGFGVEADSAGAQIATFLAIEGAALSAAVAPSNVTASASGQTVILTGTGTSWVNGITTFSLSGAGATGSSVTATSINDTTQVATLTITTGSATGTLTFTDSTNATTASVTIAAGTQVAVTDSNVYWSPFNWVSLSQGSLTSMQSNNVRGGATSIRTNNSGAYVKFAFNSPASGTLTMQFDTSMLSSAGISAGSWPKLKYSIDNGAYQTHQLASSDNNALTLATGLSAGTHTVLIYMMASSALVDRWMTPVEVWKVLGFTLSSGSSGTVSSAGTSVAPFGDKMIVFGDSETEGIQTLSDSYPALTGYDSTLSYAMAAAFALQCEVGVVGYGTASYSGATTGGSNVPAFSGFWLFYDNADARDTSQTPKYILEALGTNNTVSQAQVTAWITAMRSAWPASGNTYIFAVTIPTLTSSGNASVASTKSAAVSAWNSGNPAADKVFALAVPWAPGLQSFHGTFPTDKSFDGLHMSGTFSTQVGGYIAQQIKTLVAASIPLSLNISVDGSGHPVLTWQADPNATHYKIYRSQTQLGDAVLLATVGAGTLTYTDTSPLTGTSYYEVVSTH